MELMQRLERLSFPVKALLIGVSFFLIAGVFSVTINPLEFFRFQVDRQRNKDLKFLSQLISFIDEQAQYALLGSGGLSMFPYQMMIRLVAIGEIGVCFN